MRKISLILVVLMGISSFISCQNGNSKTVEVKTVNDSLSYAIGVDLASRLSQSGVNEFNAEAMAKGFNESFNVETPVMDNEAATAIIQKFFRNLAEMEKAKNVEAGQKFLAENAKKEGVMVTESGLQYKILKEGTGVKPQATDVVEVHYRGTLIDGTEFDASKPDSPVSFPVNGVIKGWTEALLLMPVGSKWQLFVPSDLAYGERGAGQQIKPNSTLIFDVELLSIKDKEKK